MWKARLYRFCVSAVQVQRNQRTPGTSPTSRSCHKDALVPFVVFHASRYPPRHSLPLEPRRQSIVTLAFHREQRLGLEYTLYRLENRNGITRTTGAAFDGQRRSG